MTHDEAWEEIMRIAKEHAMILQAAGGTATLVHPSVQREAGLRVKCIYMSRGGSMADAQAEADSETPAGWKTGKGNHRDLTGRFPEEDPTVGGE